MNFVAAAESVANKLRYVSSDKKHVIRQRIVKSVDSEPNINNLSVTGSDKKQYDSIVIVPADKGRATVFIDTEGNNDKIKTDLSEQTYNEVEITPTNSLLNKVNSERNLLKDTIFLTDELYKNVRSSTASTPLFYAIRTH